MIGRESMELGQQQQQAITQWRANMRAMKEKVRERLRVTRFPQRFLRQSQRHPGVGWRATATGLVVARVFQGNIVFARVARSMAIEEWQKRMGRLGDLLPRFRIFAASVAAGSVGLSEPALADGLALPSISHRPGSTIETRFGDYEVSLSLYGQNPAYQASILAPGVKSEVTEDSRLLTLMQAVAIPLIANACHVFMHGLNYTEIYGAEKMQNAVFNRAPGQPLISVSNHAAAVDDPFVISSVLSPHKLLNSKNLRWTLCASDRCFTNAATSAFFRSVKVLPLTKGHGVFQEGMEVALSKLNRGDWVHIFPEGSRSRDGNLGLFKRGVGRLVLDSEKLPLIIPFIHTGMQDIMPIGQKLPGIYKRVTVVVGDPIYMDDLVKKHTEEGLSKAILYDAIALRIEETMWRMKKELEELVVLNQTRESNAAVGGVRKIGKVGGIWQYVDWDTQGILANELDSSDSPTSADNKETVAETSLGLQRVDGFSNFDSLETPESNCKHYPDNETELCLTDMYHGAIKRIQGHIDPSMWMGFAARSFLKYGTKVENVQDCLGGRYWRRVESALERLLYS